MTTGDVTLLSEWHAQSGIVISWPHEDTDWNYILDEVVDCYVRFSKEILSEERLIVVCRDKSAVEDKFSEEEKLNLVCVEIDSNDTWARDFGPISVVEDGLPTLLDFGFNGWGLKFAADKDNQITGKLFDKGVFTPEVRLKNCQNFILEGGSIESDGEGTVMTTSHCLLAPNRNQPKSREEIENYLKEKFGAKRVLWLNHGALEGDDTDSHIDTLARFCDENTIAYVRCDDTSDSHFSELNKMEMELKAFVTESGEPYRLIPLPMADPMYDEEGNRLPGTYANFLILNDTVLMPGYSSDKDELAKDALQEAFPNRQVKIVDCSPLVKQHGSLHCVTMQIPAGFLR
jgi:agmatine deiminase